MQFFLIKNSYEVDNVLGNIKRWLETNWDFKKSCRIEFKTHSTERTISQNSLMWRWLSEVTEWAVKRGWTHDDKRRKPEEVWKLYFVSQVFGSETINMGKETIEALPGTSQLTQGEMQTLLEYINAWAIDKGINLLIPHESEYRKNQEHGN